MPRFVGDVVGIHEMLGRNGWKDEVFCFYIYIFVILLLLVLIFVIYSYSSSTC